MQMTKMNMLKIALVILGVVAVVFFLKQREGFEANVPEMNLEQTDVPKMAEPAMVEQRQQQPDLVASELLPSDENTIISQLNPSTGAESVSYKNFLEAGNMFGVDSVGSSLRNANQSLRSDPIIKQETVGPWQQSTVEPDIYRKPLESSERQ